jgi:hypothetical protein
LKKGLKAGLLEMGASPQTPGIDRLVATVKLGALDTSWMAAASGTFALGVDSALALLPCIALSSDRVLTDRVLTDRVLTDRVLTDRVLVV